MLKYPVLGQLLYDNQNRQQKSSTPVPTSFRKHFTPFSFIIRKTIEKLRQNSLLEQLFKVNIHRSTPFDRNRVHGHKKSFHQESNKIIFWFQQLKIKFLLLKFNILKIRIAMFLLHCRCSHFGAGGGGENNILPVSNPLSSRFRCACVRHPLSKRSTRTRTHTCCSAILFAQIDYILAMDARFSETKS